MSGEFKIRNIPLAFQAIIRVRNWPTYFLDLFSIINGKEIIYTMRDGIRYIAVANSTDRAIMNTVAIQDEYGLRRSGLKDLTVIDIGGHKGYFTIFSSRYAKKIYVYEPVKANYDFLLRNIAKNRLGDKVHAENIAVSHKKETLKIVLSDKNTGGHSLFRKEGHLEEVKTTTIPEIFKTNRIERCDLLKMDIEGFEYDILYNLPDSYFKKIMNIRMEVHDIDREKMNHRHLIGFLRERGYAVEFSAPILSARR